MLDTHIIDCPVCYAAAQAVVEYGQAIATQPDIFSASRNQIEVWRSKLREAPPLALPGPQYDCFVVHCCDEAAVFSNIRVCRAGVA